MTEQAGSRRGPWWGEPRPGPVLAGVLLVIVGIAWMLDTLGVVDMRWRMLVPLALVLVGIALLATARRGGSGGLTAAGIVLSVLVLVNSLAGWTAPLGAVGERDERPMTAAELEPEYEIGAGSLTLDLRDVALDPGTTSVSASVGAGELVVVLPEDTPVRLEASSGIGEVEVLGRHTAGLGRSVEETVDGMGGSQLDLDLSVGIGKVEVTR